MTSPEKLATPETVRKALQRAYSLGQTYWQQADSESFSQNRKADETAAKFQALVEETVACVLATQRQGEGVPDGWKLVPIEPTPEMVKAGYLHKHRDAYDPEADVYRAMLAAAPGATSQGVAVAQPDKLREAVILAYGHLWHVNNEPAAPIPMRSPEKAAYEARKVLRDLLTSEERGDGINKVGQLIGRYDAATTSKD